MLNRDSASYTETAFLRKKYHYKKGYYKGVIY